MNLSEVNNDLLPQGNPVEMNGWVLQQLASKNSKCFFNNLAVSICSNARCMLENPFICRNQDCQCFQKHRQCPSHSLDFVLEKITQQNNPSEEIEKSVQDIYKKFIEKINERKTHLIEGIKYGLAIKSFKNSIDDQQNKLQNLISQSPTGSVISKIIALKDSSLAKKQSVLKTRAIKLSYFNLQTKRIDPYFDHLQKLLFSEFQQFKFDQQLSAIIVPQNSGIFNGSKQFFIQMLSPSIIYANNDIVRCEIKLKTQSDILFGIGLKEKLKIKGFKIDSKSQRHGYFISSFQDNIYSLGKEAQLININGGVKFAIDEIICAEVNLKTKKLKFTNRSKMSEKIVDISFWPEIDEDQYNFCIGFTKSSDKVGIVNSQQSILMNN